MYVTSCHFAGQNPLVASQSQCSYGGPRDPLSPLTSSSAVSPPCSSCSTTLVSPTLYVPGPGSSRSPTPRGLLPLFLRVFSGAPSPGSPAVPALLHFSLLALVATWPPPESELRESRAAWFTVVLAECRMHDCLKKCRSQKSETLSGLCIFSSTSLRVVFNTLPPSTPCINLSHCSVCTELSCAWHVLSAGATAVNEVDVIVSRRELPFSREADSRTDSEGEISEMFFDRDECT